MWVLVLAADDNEPRPAELLSSNVSCCGSSAKQAASKYGLHVTAAISNQVDDDLAASMKQIVAE